MKRILFIFSFLICAVTCFSQTIQTLGAPGTNVVSRGMLTADTALGLRTNYIDTINANRGSYLKNNPGAIIRTGNAVWIRDSLAKSWVQMGSGGTIGNTIYSGDGNIVSDRTLSGSNLFSLNLDSLSEFNVTAHNFAGTRSGYIQIAPNLSGFSTQDEFGYENNIFGDGRNGIIIQSDSSNAHGMALTLDADSFKIVYQNRDPNILSSLGDYKLLAISPTGGLVNYTGSAGAPFIDSLQLDSLMKRFDLAGWGDSFTRGFVDLLGGYPEWLANQAGRQMTNNGIGGATSQVIRTAFLADRSQWLRGTIIWSGYNNRDQVAVVTADTKQMVDSLIAAGNTRYLILTIPNGPGDSLVGSTSYNYYDSIIKIQNNLTALYPGHVGDVRAFLVSKYNPALPADVTAHNQHQIPPSLRNVDLVHLTTQGYYYVARFIDSLYGNIVYNRQYSNYVIDANRIINLTQGLLPNIGIQDSGSFYIGNLPFAYRPNRYTSPNTMIFGDGGRLLTTGQDETVLGYGAGLALTSGNANHLFGYNVGKLLTTGYSNTAMGSSSMTNSATAFENTAFGFQTMLGTGAFARNVAVGVSALRTNTDGTDNTAIGASALGANDGGSNNAVVGRAAASAGTPVNRTSIIGTEGCYPCAVADNSGIGYQVLRNNVGGTRNSIMGEQGFFSNESGNDNSSVGYRAGFGTNGFNTSSYRNTAIGTWAITQIRSQANDNIALGYKAIMDSITGSNNIAICDSCDLQSRTGSDQGTIGNVIFINGGMGHGTTVGIGRVSIGTATANASALLDISSTTKGILWSRMTNVQMNAISSPATGLHVYNTDSLQDYQYNGSAWVKVGSTVAAGSVSSVSGTANRITSSGGTTPVIDIAATYVGQTSLTTLGTVTIGTLSTGAVIGGVTMTLGSDAANDIYYRNGSGVLTRLANGTTGQFLAATTGSAPSWSTPSAGGSPGGSDTYVQFNRNGVFAGVDSLTWTANGLDTKYRYRINGVQVAWLPNQTSFPSVMYIGNGTGSALAAGATLNTAVGLGGALGANTTGASVTAIGSRAFQANTTGSNNTGVGDAPGFSNTTGAGNTYLGKSAGQSNQTASNIVAVGASAFLNNTAAQGIAIGATAGNGNTSGPDNVLIGFQAAFQNSTGGGNTIVGTQAAVGVSSNNFSNNTYIGYKVANANTTGSGNIAIGDSAARTLTTAIRSITIGTNLTENGNFSLNIGGAIFGTGMTATGTSAAGNIGIGITTPREVLDVNGILSIRTVNAGVSVDSVLIYEDGRVKSIAGNLLGATASTGLTNTTGTWTADLSTGVSGGQTLRGGTAANNQLIVRGSIAASGSTVTNPDVTFVVGDGAGTTTFQLRKDASILHYGSMWTPIRTVTTTTTSTVTDYTILVDASGGAVTINLIAAASFFNTSTGGVLIIKKIDASANTVTIDANGSETIDGATTQTLLTQWSSYTIQDNGTAWFVL